MNKPQTIRGPVAGLIGLLVSSCASSTVRVPVDDARSDFREMQKLDCGTYDTREKSLTVGLDFGLLWGAANAGPYAKRAEITGVKWDKGVHIIVLQYKEVCSRFNSGALTQDAYDTRIAEIDQFYSEAAGIRQSADEIIRGHSEKAFGELDKDTAGGGGSAEARVQEADGVATAVDALVGKLGVQ